MTRSTHRFPQDGRLPDAPTEAAVPFRPQVLAGGRSLLWNVRRRHLRSLTERLLVSVADGLATVDPRSALLAARTLGSSPFGRPRLVVVPVSTADDRRADA